jgi:hypothetical protein
MRRLALALLLPAVATPAAAEDEGPADEGLGTHARIGIAQGAGLGGVAAGLGGVAVTGAAFDLVGPFIGLSIAGGSALFTGFLAHGYALLAPPDGTGAPDREPPWLEAELGHRYVHDPVFEFRHFAVAGLSWRTGRWRLSPDAWLAADDDNWRLRLGSAFRLLGPRPGSPAEDGSFLDVEVAGLHHRYGTERFSMSTLDLAVAGRLDLRRFAPGLTGSFAELALGSAWSAYHYDGLTTEDTKVLLGRFAFGMYLGHDPAGWGELAVFYDHRHDDFAAGAKLPGIGSGAIGHAGLRLRTAIDGPWGVGAEFAAGSAYVGGVSVLYRMGGTR